MLSNCLLPEWPAPANVRALVTLRHGGISAPPYASLNLGDHVGDDPLAVAANRARLRDMLPSEPVWLNQVHGVGIVNAADAAGIPPADGSYSRIPGTVCAVLTADCLPVLFCDRAGSVVAAAHAGWRGLANGVLEAAVHSMAVDAGEILAWLGPAIGPQSFEVGDEVREVFMRFAPEAELAFRPHNDGKWLADIFLLARQRLARVGISQVSGGGECTYRDHERFYSYRREGTTGRMGALIWLL